MNPKPFTNRSLLRLATGCAAAALAAGPLKNSKLKYPLFALAGFQAANWLMRPGQEASGAPSKRVAPELVRCEKIDGILMRWEDHSPDAARGLPVVMVHGLPTNPRVWRYVLPTLHDANIRCLAWEQVGFGWSMQAGLERDLSIPKQAEYLHQWLQHLGIDKAVFVGHDYGGGVVQRFVAEHPERVAGLVLADSVAFKNWPVTAVRMAQAVAPVLRRLPPMLIKPVLFAAVDNLHSTRSIHGESFEAIFAPYNRTIGPKALAHQLQFFHNEDTEATAEKLGSMPLSFPTRILCGTKDPLGLQSAKQLAQLFNAPLTEITGARHFTPEDHPAEVASAIRAVHEDAEERQLH